ncbi:hypothetical protein ABGN05_16025 [Aquibium sp. LZ166]|uniref:Uncharacterized protein n=1 Tax=Aquibium pacificus TaxID=3153579 RepID=A0ABV3SK71_9HYPH
MKIAIVTIAAALISALLSSPLEAVDRPPNMTAQEQKRYCDATRQCRAEIKKNRNLFWVHCMEKKGFKTKTGDGYRICGNR